MRTESIALNIRTLRNGAKLNLLRLAGTPPPGDFLSAAELDKCASFRMDKRRNDWLGGRYAAKTLLRELLGRGPDLREIEISYDGFGRPVWNGKTGIHLVSITHSGPYCAAAAKPGPSVFLGLDLEKAEPRIGPWYEDYFHKEELAPVLRDQGTVPFYRELTLAGKGDSPRRLEGYDPEKATRLWTEKEALLKALGLGLKADPLDIKIGKEIQFSGTALERYEKLGRPGYLIETERLDSGYYLSTVADR